MDDEVKAALLRFAQIKDQSEQGLFGYSVAVFEVYGHLPERQLYQDAATIRDFLASQEG